MIALLIIGGIVLILLILLNLPITADISYISEVFDLKVKYLGILCYPRPEKPEKPAKPKKRRKRKKKKSQKDIQKKTTSEKYMTEAETKQTPPTEQVEKKPEEKLPPKENAEKKKPEKVDMGEEKEDAKQKLQDIKEKIKLVKRILISSKKGLRMLLRDIKIYDIFIDIDVADLDAAEAAISYGKMNAIVYNAISFIRVFFTISLKKIIINCKYNSDESRYDFAASVRIRPSVIILAVISIAFNYYVNLKKEEKNKDIERNVEKHERASN